MYRAFTSWWDYIMFKRRCSRKEAQFIHRWIYGQQKTAIQHWKTQAIIAKTWRVALAKAQKMVEEAMGKVERIVALGQVFHGDNREQALRGFLEDDWDAADRSDGEYEEESEEESEEEEVPIRKKKDPAGGASWAALGFDTKEEPKKKEAAGGASWAAIGLGKEAAGEPNFKPKPKDEPKPKPAETGPPKSTLENLCGRFPKLEQSVVADILSKESGHAGRAAKRLQAMAK